MDIHNEIFLVGQGGRIKDEMIQILYVLGLNTVKRLTKKKIESTHHCGAYDEREQPNEMKLMKKKKDKKNHK